MSSSIIELENEARWAEAGYGRIFAYQSLHFNAMVDARTKAKRMREFNPMTFQDLQFDLLYSGPTVFLDKHKNFKDKIIEKADLISAYASYLDNIDIKKPGIYRKLHKGCLPLSERIQLYVIRFNCDVNNLFAKWFLNSSHIQLKKIKTGNGRIWGELSIFSSIHMNLFEYVNMFLEPSECEVIKTYTFYGKQVMTIDHIQIRKLFDKKQLGDSKSKQELTASTGWLAIVDRPTYYHMIQYIKFWLLKIVYDLGINDYLIGVQTDCIFYIEHENSKTQFFKDLMKSYQLGIYKDMGTLKIEKFPSNELITYNRRVKKDENN